MRNVSDKTCTENRNTFYVQCIFSRKPCVYETVCQVTDENMIRRKRFACWITKATNTHSQYVTLIALPRQQQFRVRASMLRHTYIACLVTIKVLLEQS